MNRSRSAWQGPQLADREDEWIHRVRDTDVAELERAHDALKSRGFASLDDVGRDDFPLSDFARTLASLGEEVEAGRGFAFLRGLPVDRWGIEKSRVIYWGISCHLGTPLRQNARAEKLVKVTDVGAAEKATSRGPYGRGDMNFHSDFADVVGLLCLRASKTGGVSRICSSHAILERMAVEHPEYLDVFERGFRFFRKAEEAVGEPPVSARRLPMLDRSGALPRFLFWRAFAEQGAQFSGEPLTALEAAALAYVNDVARDPAHHLDTHFQPGDIQYLNNYRILHSRTEFEDWPEPERRRYLERVWLRTSDARVNPEGFADTHGPNSIVDGFPLVPADVVAARERALAAHA
ncbi:TauD/TfdA family dioxygenase [Ramlibacter sp.]|uniref:TauD/TfdA family dioxygenase n=1 Tax=Ramlibacter sp. TaxID=1917967 RepID=UPI003D10B196